MSSTQPTPATRSPCVRNCCLDGDDVCVGCGRTLAEILAWHDADQSRRQQICANAQRRRQQRRGPGAAH